MHHQHRVIGGRLRAVGAQSGRVAVELDAYRKAAEGFDHLGQAVEGGPYDLRDTLPTLLSSAARQTAFEINAPVRQQMVRPPQIVQGPEQMVQRPQQMVQGPPPREEDPCGPPVGRSDWEDCRVASQVRRQFQRYGTLLRADVLTPLQALAPAPTGPDLGALEVGLDSIQAAFEARLAANPRFWERFTGKTDFFSQLRGDLEELWRQYSFESQRLKLEAERQRLDTLRQTLERRQDALEAGEQRLSARLAELDSPFGKLPVGLVEAVQLFPLLMVMGFVWLYVVLRRLVGLRQALRKSYQQLDLGLGDLTDRHLALVAPLWVDRGHRALGYALLLRRSVCGVRGGPLLFRSAGAGVLGGAS